MGLYYFVVSLLMLVFVSEICGLEVGGGPTFDQNYQVSYGYDHILLGDKGRDVQLSLDSTSGAGFESRLPYSSGLFQMNIRPPMGDSAGVLVSERDGDRDEVDFEFLGNREGKPTLLQTNIYKDGKGEREQRFKLWFDPTETYHTYRILWNQHQIVFFVDNVPIRVFKNNGGNSPNKAMKVKATIWNGENWATDGGKEKIDWAAAPFQAHFAGFSIDGCPSIRGGDCYSTDYWWNEKQYWTLNSEQERMYQDVKKMYMTYNYCDDRSRYTTPPPECQ
ncbi:hypothetical protein LguiA_001821 [Lonicera macranthoides]